MTSSANAWPARAVGQGTTRSAGFGLAEIGLAAVVGVLAAAALSGQGLPRPTLRTPPPPPAYSTVDGGR